MNPNATQHAFESKSLDSAKRQTQTLEDDVIVGSFFSGVASVVFAGFPYLVIPQTGHRYGVYLVGIVKKYKVPKSQITIYHNQQCHCLVAEASEAGRDSLSNIHEKLCRQDSGIMELRFDNEANERQENRERRFAPRRRHKEVDPFIRHKSRRDLHSGPPSTIAKTNPSSVQTFQTADQNIPSLTSMRQPLTQFAYAVLPMTINIKLLGQELEGYTPSDNRNALLSIYKQGGFYYVVAPRTQDGQTELSIFFQFLRNTLRDEYHKFEVLYSRNMDGKLLC